jgi:hypothetical protein
MPSPDHYIPGVCNIGPAEIRRRMFSGWIGFIATLALAAVLFYYENPPIWRLLLFLPAFQAATGFLQGLYHFCLGFGFKAVFNFGEPGHVDSVTEAEFRKADRKKAQKILVESAIVGAAVALGTYFMPQ